MAKADNPAESAIRVTGIVPEGSSELSTLAPNAAEPMAAALWTSYDASFPAQMGGGDKKALPSRRQTS
jgi:hypothetical protein